MAKARKLDRVIDYLLEQIDNGTFVVGDKIPSEYELAERLGVNKTTANKAVGQLVARGLLQRGRGARGTRLVRSRVFPRGTVACLLSSGTDFHAQLLFSAVEYLYKAGYRGSFHRLDSAENTRHFFEDLRAMAPDGIITVDHGRLPQDMNAPVIYLDSLPPGDAVTNSVTCDNRAGGALVAEHLVAAGHRCIGYVLSNRLSATMLDRAAGFAEAVAAGKGCRLRSMEVSGSRTYSPRVFLDRLKAEHPACTAVAFDTDFGAARLCRYLDEQGEPAPGSLSVTGFGNLGEVQEARSITTVEQHPSEMGFQAGRAMVDLIEGTRQPGIREVVPVELVPGKSVGRPATVSG